MSHLFGETNGSFQKGSSYDDLMGKIIVRRGGPYYVQSIIYIYGKERAKLRINCERIV